MFACQTLLSQAFEKELASLPGCYSRPAGCILLLSHQHSPGHPRVDVGCVAVRPLESNHSAHGNNLNMPAQQEQQEQPEQQDLRSTCEMKRLWVTQEHQGKGLGKALATAAIAAAQQSGYSTMVLDTLQTLTAANQLYSGLGFVQRAAYYHNPLADVVYWELPLGRCSALN